MFLILESPDVEVAQKVGGKKSKLDIAKTGSGAPIDLNKDYLIVMYHPVAAEFEHMAENTDTMIKADQWSRYADLMVLAKCGMWVQKSFLKNFDSSATVPSNTIFIS